MAVLDPNAIFFTAFEPKVQNRFIMYVDGIPSYTIKAISAVTFDQGEIILNHVNTYRKINCQYFNGLKWILKDLKLPVYRMVVILCSKSLF